MTRWRLCAAPRACLRDGDGGVALVVALLVLSILGVLGLGLSLVVSADPLAAANQREATAARYIARAGLAVAMNQLASASSWDAWLSGASTSAIVDGPPSGNRHLASGDTVDIGLLTSRLTCGEEAACSEAQAAAVTTDRPWGANNPHWRPFVYGTTQALGLGDASDRHYIVVWIADDPSETDGRPDADGALGAGGGVAWLRAEAFGPFHSRRAVQALVSRRCEIVDDVAVCGPGLRTMAWRTP